MNTELPFPDQIIDIHNHGRPGSDGEDLVELMDAHGIERAVVLGLPVENTARNPDVLRAVRKHPDRLIGGAFADPRAGQAAIEEIRRYHAEGFRIVKLFPNYGYYPDDESLRPFFDTVAELKMAVLSHCGWLSPRPGREQCAAYYSHPGRFEKLIRSYGQTVFILGHMGGIAGFLETIMLTTRTPNAYADCSPGQGLWVLESAGGLAASIPPEKLLWGCDSYQYAQYIPRYRAALEQAGFGPHLEAIFYGNARRLLVELGAIDEAT